MAKIMNGCFMQNVDKLTWDELDLVQFALGSESSLVGAIEVRLDNPIENMMIGGEGFVTHYISGSEHYLRHKGESDWAIIQKGAVVGDYDKGRKVAVNWCNKIDEVTIELRHA